jgi:hypothetical protein
MRSFIDLQDLFAAYQTTAIGLRPEGMRLLQGAAAIAAGDDSSIWNLLDSIPTPDLILPISGAGFFDVYTSVIAALIAGTGPLDPIAAAKRNLTAWGDKAPAWDGGFRTLNTRLNAAPRLAFTFELPLSTTTDLWGLWRLADPCPGPSARLALGALNMNVQFAHLLNFAPLASDWYTPSAMVAAYQNPNKAPWNPASPITWDTTFGPTGTLRAVVSGLICVSGLTVDYTSSIAFSADDQAAILSHAEAGIWPYYLDQTVATTRVTFNASNHISVSISSDRTTPIVIGAAVQSASAFFVGH